MSDKCPKCGEKFVRYPLRDENGKFILKNMFRMDMMSILFLVCVIFMTVGYILDMSKCNDAINYPCTFCEKSNCCIISKNIVNKSDAKTGFELPDEFEFTL